MRIGEILNLITVKRAPPCPNITVTKDVNSQVANFRLILVIN